MAYQHHKLTCNTFYVNSSTHPSQCGSKLGLGLGQSHLDVAVRAPRPAHHVHVRR